MAKKESKDLKTQQASKSQSGPAASQKEDALTDEELEAASGGVISLRDPASGLPTGKRMHKPYTLTSEIN